MTIPKHIQEVFPKQHQAFLTTFFQHCPTPILERILIQHFPKHYSLIDASDDNTYVFILLSGKLQAIEERVVNIPYQFLEVTPLDIVGDYEVFSQTQGHYVTLKTTMPSTCLQIRSNDYLAWMRQDVHALFLRTQMLVQVLSTQTQQQRQFLFMDTTQRLAIFLVDKAKQQSLPFRLVETREQIASQIGCSVRQLNRIIKELQEQTICSLHHGKLIVSKHGLQLLEEKADHEI
ncbi:Crp/Fnr family transcriptional regulator [Amedibacillus sp. YH-ame6]